MMLWYIYNLLWFSCLLKVFISEQQTTQSQYGHKIEDYDELQASLRLLDNTCIDSGHLDSTSPYMMLCFFRSILSVRSDVTGNFVSASSNPIVGTYSPENTQSIDKQIYITNRTNCISSNQSQVVVALECCSDIPSAQSPFLSQISRPSMKAPLHTPSKELDTYIASFHSVDPCKIDVVVCTSLICARDDLPSNISDANQDESVASSVSELPFLTKMQQEKLKERTKEIFYHAYDSYMQNAYPAAELKPISCEGGNFDLIKIPYVTLVDTIDTLVIFGNYTEFRRVVQLLHRDIPNFDFDVNVSLFETTIRLLGGLLSAHLMAIDPMLNIYPMNGEERYENELLSLAIDLADRLIPAFQTKTGIPYGTVNLHSGVPKGETKIASLAGAGTLLMEFQILSYLTNNTSYGMYAYTALNAIYTRRSPINLVGKHIHVDTGHWHETISSLGSNSDSFYEYLLKSYTLSQSTELYTMFQQTYDSVHTYLVENEDTFVEVEMHSGKMFRKKIENLVAFWPGIESLLGYHLLASIQLNKFYDLWNLISFLPEELDYTRFEEKQEIANPSYSLRPELIESTYYHYQATKDRSWLVAGEHFLSSIEENTRTGCGYASVGNIASMELDDTMPSFFLSETCKYLYLLFDDEHVFHHRSSYIFSTEAHPFDLNQIYQIRKKFEEQQQVISVDSIQDNNSTSVMEEETPSYDPLFLKIRNRKSNSRGATTGATTLPTAAATPSFVKDKIEHMEGMNEVSVEDDDDDEMTGESDTSSNKPLQRVPTQKINCPKQTKWYHAGFLKYEPILINTATDNATPAGNEGTKTATVKKTDEPLSTAARKGLLSSAYRIHRQEKSTKSMKHFLRLTALVQLQQQANDGVAYDRMITIVDHLPSLKKLLPPKCKEEDHITISPELRGKSNTKTATNGENGNDNTKADEDEIFEVPDELKPIKQVDISLGILGNFKIKVFADGFKVFNKLDKRTLEIANVGKRAIFIREFEASKTGTKRITSVVGKIGSHALTCLFKLHEFNHTTNAARLIMQRHCSTANFGQKPPFSLQAEIFVPDYAREDVHMCPKEKAAAAAKKSSTAEKLRQWWQRLKENPLMQFKNVPSLDNLEDLAIPRDEESSSQSISSPDMDMNKLDGKMVVTQRGNCLFEEKAIMIQKHNAKALIVANKENTLFVMAGKKELDEEVTATAGAGKDEEDALEKIIGKGIIATNSEANEDPIYIPTIMITRNDYLELESKVKEQFYTGDIYKGTIEVQSNHAVFQTELMGNNQYPKVFMTKSIIYIITGGRWGAYFKTQQGNDWQMFLVDKKDISTQQLLPPVQIRTKKGQKILTSTTLMQSSQKLYSQVLQRKCPKHIQVDKHSHLVKLS